MNLVPLRTAVLAGTCAVALSFAAVPAFASNDSPGDSSSTSSASQAPGDDSTMSNADDSGDDDTTTGDDNGADETGTGTDDNGDSDATDPTPAPTDSAAPLPTEQGTPQHHLQDGELTPLAVVRHGIRVEYSGLTPHAAYQPFFTTSQSGGPIGDPKKANGAGRLRVTWYPAANVRSPFARAGAEYGIGLTGTQTQLTLVDEITVGYDSELYWAPAKRHHGTVTLEVRAEHARASTTAEIAWKRVRVAFQKKVDHHWVTVTTKRTDAKGVAKATFVAGKNVWRAVVEPKGHIFGSTTRGHRK